MNFLCETHIVKHHKQVISLLALNHKTFYQNNEQLMVRLKKVTDLCRTLIRSRQPIAISQEVNQMVDNHLALLLIAHFIHKDLKQKKIHLVWLRKSSMLQIT